MLPAHDGDCLWIEYGRDRASARRILIDAGRPESWTALKRTIEATPVGKRKFELFVVTHVDDDHVGGALDLLKELDDLKVKFKDIWFNGYVHLNPGFGDELGPESGEELTETIVEKQLPWNRAFGGKAVVVPKQGKLPMKRLEGGLELTVLGPTRAELDALEPLWVDVVRDAGLVRDYLGAQDDEVAEDDEDDLGDLLGELDVEQLASTTFRGDPKEANGSSIILVATYQGRSILLGADGHVSVLLKTLPRLDRSFRESITWMKVPHHGSSANINQKLLDQLKCTRFLLSSNGNRHKHPTKVAIARILKGAKRPRLYFNYRTAFNQDWDDESLMEEYGYTVKYPADGREGLKISLAR